MSVLGRLVSPLVEAPAMAPLGDPAQVRRAYARLRREALLGSMAGYALFYLCRKNLSAGLPLLSSELGYSNTDLGILGSALYVTYGLGKLVNGLLADRAHPRRMLVLGLVLSAGANLLFGFSTSLVALGVAWGLNGLFQSTGAPASAKVLAVWFSASERGTKTGIWNISHQGGGGLALVVAGLLAARFGWRGAFIGPALLCLVGAALVARFIHDRPEAYGLPNVAVHRGEPPEDASLAGRGVVALVLANPNVWIVALASLCTYVVRYGALDWSPKFLFETRGMKVAEASVLSSLLELVGIPGALLCGWLSDRVFGTRRAPVVFASLVLLAASVWALFAVRPGSRWVDAALLAAIGFFTYGPQMLLAGVAPVDQSARRVAAAAVGFTGLMSYAGATLSSVLTGKLLDTGGWRAAFAFWVAAALAGAVLCLPQWNRRPTSG